MKTTCAMMLMLALTLAAAGCSPAKDDDAAYVAKHQREMIEKQKRHAEEIRKRNDERERQLKLKQSAGRDR